MRCGVLLGRFGPLRRGRASGTNEKEISRRPAGWKEGEEEGWQTRGTGVNGANVRDVLEVED